MNAPRWAVPVRRFVFFLILVLAAIAVRPRPAAAQSLDPKLYVPNGTVYAVASHGDTIYAGGAFTEVGRPTGGAATFDPATGEIVGPLPTVLGQVHTIISDGSGGCYIGGQFTHVGGLPRENLAHIAADNTVSSWNPGALNEVYALCLSPHGGVYVGGSFTQIAGTPRSRFAEVRTDGTLTSFAPLLNGTVRAIVVQDTSVIVGGDFTAIGINAQQRLAKFTISGILNFWFPDPNGPVHALRVITRGGVPSILVGGSFASIGGAARNNAARIVPSTGAATTWNPNVNGPVYAFGELGNDIYIGGSFNFVPPLACSNIVIVNDGLGTPLSWTPVVNGEVRSIFYRASTTSVLIGGRFSSAGGQARRGLAALNSSSPGAALAWNPRPNHDVETIFDNGSRIFAGGVFEAANMVTRNRLASFVRSTGQPTSWNPNANHEVRALALDVFGTSLRSVIVGGYFSNVGGAARASLAALDPATGVATSWNPSATGGGASVRTFCLTGGTLYVGGDFTSLGGQIRNAAGAFTYPTGTLTTWNPNVGGPGGTVWALAATTHRMFIGGAFPSVGLQPRANLACVDRSLGAVLPFVANTNDYVFDLALYGSNVYAGGWFTTMNATPRNFLAAMDTTTGTVGPWNPNPGSTVNLVLRTGDKLLIGGGFETMQGLPRRGGARVDPVTGAPDSWSAETDGLVFSADVYGSQTVVGGAFNNIQWFARRSLAQLELAEPPVCPSGPLTSQMIDQPRALASGDFNLDGIADLIICHTTPVPLLGVDLGIGSAGVGDGTFQPFGSWVLPAPPQQAVVADFDADGRPDVAVTVSDATGLVIVFRGQSNGFIDDPVEFPLFGRAEGIAAGDVTNDGILDLAVCLRDSAGFVERGGIQLLRGEGANGIWNGNFVTEWKAPTDGNGSSARRLVLQDFNADGTLDILFSGWAPSAHRLMKMGPGGVLIGSEIAIATYSPQESNVGMAVGDLDGDARGDYVMGSRRRVAVRLRSASDDPGQLWFAVPKNTNLPSTPREFALVDWDFDGKLDLVCTMDSLSRVELHRGVGDGTFEESPIILGSMDAYGLLVGDFATNGSADLLVSQPGCASVTTIPNTAINPMPTPLVLTAPNGGEVWAQQPLAEGTSAVVSVLPVTDDLVAAPAMRGTSESRAAAPPSPVVASTQFVTWTKGAGIATVDVDVSRDGGQSWQPLGRNQPGTALRWIVTPPASQTAIVRVRDSGVSTRSDVSDAFFDIPATTVAVDPLPSLPRVAAIRMAGANPVRATAVAFRVDVPRASEVRVDVYDAAGRHVRTVARGRYEAGTHDLAWSTRSDGAARGSAPHAGLYFVRALVGEAEAKSKFVVLP